MASDNMASLVCRYCNIEMHIAMYLVRKYRMRILSSCECYNQTRSPHIAVHNTFYIILIIGSKFRKFEHELKQCPLHNIMGSCVRAIAMCM